MFERLAKEVYLTEAGRVLFAKAQTLLSLAQETEQAVREAAGVSAGKLALGVGSTLATYVLPELLRRFNQQYANIGVATHSTIEHSKFETNGHATVASVKFDITLGNTENLAQKLLKNEVDLALLGSPMESHPLLELHPFLEDKLIVVVSPNDTWAKTNKTTINLSELSNRTLLVRERGSALQAFVENMLSACHAQANQYLVMANLEAIKRSVEIGLGTAIVPALSVQREVEAGRLHTLNIEGVEAGRTFIYAHHKDKELSRPARLFLELVQSYRPAEYMELETAVSVAK